MDRGRGSRVRPASNVAAPSRTPSAQQHTGNSAQSVLQHDIFASTTPANASRTTTLPPSTNYLERAIRAPATGRFKPKNVRRNQVSLDALARREAEKDNAKRADEARQQSRGRFRSRRSRGSMMGRGGLDRRSAAGAGSLSDFQVGGGGGDWKGKAYGPPGFRRAAGRRYHSDGDGVGPFDDYADRKPRINADRLNVHTADGQENGDEYMLSAMDSSSTGTVWPMGIYRKEHKDIEFTVATTAELEAQEHDPRADAEPKPPHTSKKEEEGVMDDNKPWHAAPKNLAHKKKEPDEPTIIDFDSEMKNPPPPPPEPESAQEEAKPLNPLSRETEEDMMAADLNLLAEELGLCSLGESETDTTTGMGTDTGASGVKNKDGRLYLFQFPPVLPPLRVIPGTERSGSAVVKHEEPDDIVMLGTTAAQAAKKAHDGGLGSFVSHMPSSKGGIVGRLNVRKSGKVEFDWGGTTLEMSPAAAMSFVTTAVIVEQNDEKAGAGGGLGGESIGMGRIMGRFVLSPVWGEEDDWDVAPEDLEVDAGMF